MLKIYNKAHVALTVIIILAAVLACGRDAVSPVDPAGAVSPFASYRDIPGVTAQEIAAIEALQRENRVFIYGMNHTTEAFPIYSSQDNEGGIYAVGGYAVRLCEWLTALFNMPFKPVIYGYRDLLSGLENDEIHFTGDLMPTDERRETHFMTGTISDRSLKTFQIAGVPSVAEIAKSRPPRLAFIYGFTPFDYVSEVTDYAFEPVFVSNHDEAYRAIKNGEADAFLTLSIAEISFDVFDDVVSETFYPLVFNSASLSTQNPDLAPVISVVQKALENGGASYLAGLYTLGHRDYMKNKFLEYLTPEEREYIRRNPVVKVATESDSYPLSFYNKNDKELQGIAFDVMSEIKLVTGLSFEVVSPRNAGFLVLTDMVQGTGEELSFIGGLDYDGVPGTCLQIGISQHPIQRTIQRDGRYSQGDPIR